jgi:hypothetical protein
MKVAAIAFMVSAVLLACLIVIALLMLVTR